MSSSVKALSSWEDFRAGLVLFPNIGLVISHYPIECASITVSVIKFHKIPWISIYIHLYGSVSKPCTPVVHIKIAGKWMFIPLKMVLIGIDPYPYPLKIHETTPLVGWLSTSLCLGPAPEAWRASPITCVSKSRREVHCHGVAGDLMDDFFLHRFHQ